MQTNEQRSHTSFLVEYDGISLYDIDLDKIYKFDYEYIFFVNKDWYALIGNPDHPHGTSTYHEYFIIHDDLFDRILETDQNTDISLKVAPKDVLFPSINDISTYSISKLRNSSEIVSPRNQIQRKQQKIVHDYSKNFIDDFKLIVVYPPPKLTDINKIIV